MNELRVGVLAAVALAFVAGCRPGARSGTGPSPSADDDLGRFAERFRSAVLERDAEWVLSAMDPEGWQCGDMEMAAADYAQAFRSGYFDAITLFDGEQLRRGSILPHQLAYREWFGKCPSARVVFESEGPAAPGGTAYVIRWEGPSCPEPVPAMRVVHSARGIVIRVFGGCL